MTKDLRSFLDDCRREIPNKVIQHPKEVSPVNSSASLSQGERKGHRVAPLS